MLIRAMRPRDLKQSGAPNTSLSVDQNLLGFAVLHVAIGTLLSGHCSHISAPKFATSFWHCHSARRRPATGSEGSPEHGRRGVSTMIAIAMTLSVLSIALFGSYPNAQMGTG